MKAEPQYPWNPENSLDVIARTIWANTALSADDANAVADHIAAQLVEAGFDLPRYPEEQCKEYPQ